MSERTLLVGDIGGTNARFALADPERVGFERNLSLKCADHDDIEQAIEHYLGETEAPCPEIICLAVAGPVDGQHARLTNNPWQISAKTLSERFNRASVDLVNDFTAIAHAVPFLCPQDCLSIGSIDHAETADGDLTFGIIGPGTGLGASALFRRNGYSFALESEAGHVGFAAETARQESLLAALRERFPRVSNERLLSGGGLENIYWALHRVSGQPFNAKNAAQIFQAAGAGSDSLASESVQLFFEVLGQAAGDLALAFGAVNGIYIAGGMSQRYPQLITESRFRLAFENKGRHRAYMERIPSKLVMHPNPGLLGASAMARECAVAKI